MTPAIETSGLRKRFGKTYAVDGIDLTVARGAVYGLLGPNGAGKTTTIRVLATLLRPDGGSARVLGHDVVAEAARVRESVSLTNCSRSSTSPTRAGGRCARSRAACAGGSTSPRAS